MSDSVLTRQNEKYNIVIENFEGPMDLLLFLITKHKMNIFDISLSELTDKYVEYLDEMTESNLEVTSEFIVMAATLLDIKARRLLPELEPKEDEENVITEQDMINRIIEYKKYKEVSELINDMYSNNFGSFVKPFEKIKYKEKTIYSGQPIDVRNMFELYTSLLERNINKINKKAEEIDKIAIYEKVTVKDKVEQIVNYLRKNNKMIFNSMFNVKKCNNVEVVTAFLGLLELSKLKQILVNQEYLFSDINVEKNNSLDKNIDLSKISE